MKISKISKIDNKNLKLESSLLFDGILVGLAAGIVGASYRLLIGYSEKPESSKAVCKKLGLDGYTIINLVEPFSTASYRNAFYNKNDYIESQDEKEAATCSAWG